MSLLSTLVLTTGLWHASLTTPGGPLPFEMDVQQAGDNYTFSIINGEEAIFIDDVIVEGDSVFVHFPVYESELRLKRVDRDHLTGTFINWSRTTHRSLPFDARAGLQPRFPISGAESKLNVTGRWAVTFAPGTADSSFVVGLFEQRGQRVTGTFLSTSGDYRYLDGSVSGDSLFLSTFNGVFVYLFKARIRNNKISGMFYSGAHRQVNVSGYRDANAQLQNPDSITTYNEAAYPLDFRLPDPDSILVSINDPDFKNKVVLIQIMGSWCPNCIDETRFLAPYYDANWPRGFVIVGLSFEKHDDFGRCAKLVKGLMSKLNIHYPVLVATRNQKVKDVLPGIERFAGYPTTIILDRNHRIRRIHAGFSGAATGMEYEKYKEEFSLFMEKLLAE